MCFFNKAERNGKILTLFSQCKDLESLDHSFSTEYVDEIKTFLAGCQKIKKAKEGLKIRYFS